MKFITRLLLFGGAAVCTLALSVEVLAQGFPTKPVRLIVPYPPGGATDTISRAAAIEMSKTLGQPVVVDNRPGAGGSLGFEIAARSAPDGYTMLTSGSALYGITPLLYSKLAYDPNKDLDSVMVLTSFTYVLVVNPAVKANSVKDLIALARAQPGKLTFASSGSGSGVHLAGEMFKQMLGLEITHIPYRGSGPAITDLVGGQVHMIFDNSPAAISQAQSGKLRALATTGAKRAAALPDLPTMVEAGVPGYEAGGWFSLALPAGTPKAIIARLNAAGQKATKSPEFIKRMSDLGYEIVGGTPEQMDEMIKNEIRRWGPIVKASGAKVE